MILVALALLATPAANFDVAAETTSLRATLAALVAADTTNPPGNEARIVTLLAARLKKEGIPYEISDFGPNRKNLVARLKGSGKEKPLLLLAHTDVVGTASQAWSTPPHTLSEKDGFLYGRGVRDDLLMVAANLETITLLKRAGTKLRRDLVVAFTGDEESGGGGIRALLEHDPSLYDVGLVINEGGGVVNDTIGGPISYVTYEVAQKTIQDFTLTTTGTTGHSSVPRRDNAINRLAKALAALDGTDEPARLLEVTRAYFKARARIEEVSVARAMNAIVDAPKEPPREALEVVERSPIWSALMRTTCIATMVAGGTKTNALPASATANINCRILPDESVEQVQKRLATIINDPGVVITTVPSRPMGPPSSTGGELAEALTKVLAARGVQVPLIPTLMLGGTDSSYFRQHGTPAYGFAPFPGLESDGSRAHGIDERLQIAAIRPGLELYNALMLELAAER